MLKTLYAEQKKRHRFIEQSFRLCGRCFNFIIFGHTIKILQDSGVNPRLLKWKHGVLTTGLTRDSGNYHAFKK